MVYDNATKLDYPTKFGNCHRDIELGLREAEGPILSQIGDKNETIYTKAEIN